MSKKAKILISALGSLPLSLWAQAPDDDLEHVLVTVPMHRSQAETALPVTVLSGEQLRRRAASTIGETLSSTAGLSNGSFGPAVGQPVIRGQQGPRVTVLQNSTSSADASNVSADHAVSVEAVLAESVEVLRGPATLLYGGGAIGGVVNVIDNRVPSAVPEKTTAVAEYRHGSVNDEDTSVVKIETGTGQWALHIDGLYRQTNNLRINGPAIIGEEDHDEGHDDEDHSDEQVDDNYIANSDSQTDSITVGGSWFFDGGYIGLAVNRLNNVYGLPRGGHSEHEDEEDHDDDDSGDHEEHEEGHGEGDIRLQIEQTRYDLRGAWESPGESIEAVRWFLTYSDYEHQEITEEGVGTTFTNELWENRLELVHQQWHGWHGVLGLQLKHSEFAAIGDESFIPASDTESAGLFLVEDYHRGEWLYELGVRLEHSDVDPDSLRAEQHDYTNVSVSASALWQFDEQWSLGLALSRSERAPTVEELFSNIENEVFFVVHEATRSIEIGDQNLSQEVANNLDLSLSWDMASTKGFVTVFYNDFNDYIYLANSGGDQDEVPIFNYSQDGAVFTGLEFEVNWNLTESVCGICSVDIFGDYIQGELDNHADVPRLPPMRIGGRLNVETGPWSAYISVVNASDQDHPGENESETDGYSRWDAGLSYLFSANNNLEYLTFVRLKNISDEEIRHSVSYLRDIAPEAGRSIEAGVRVMLN